MVSKTLIRKVLKYDPLLEAENITGERYDNHENSGELSITSALGMMLHIDHNKNKEDLLKMNKDIYFNISLKEYLEIIEDIGFQKVSEIKIVGDYPVNDLYFIYYHPQYGILLSFDSYYGQKCVNGGTFYYNWKPNDPDKFYHFISSGGFYDDGNGNMIWAGYHDCREAIRLHISDLVENGTFITPWIKCPYIRLTHYKDYNREKEIDLRIVDYEALTIERCQNLPESIKNMIMGQFNKK